MQTSSFLRRILALDAMASGGMGVVLALGAGALSPMLGLPEPLMRGAGVFLAGYGLVIGWMARRHDLPHGAVLAVVGLNALWVLESIAVLLLGWVQPTALGYAVVIAQAAAVGVLAELQFIALRRVGRGA